jgi:hypothetical protein
MGERIRAVVKTPDEYRAWLNAVAVWVQEEWTAASSQSGAEQFIAQSGETPFLFYPNGRFMWVCPGCGGATMGTLGDAPVGGWDGPRWTREGDDEHLTLTPSLGCPRWRDGTCSGHYWLRDGELVGA